MKFPMKQMQSFGMFWLIAALTWLNTPQTTAAPTHPEDILATVDACSISQTGLESLGYHGNQPDRISDLDPTWEKSWIHGMPYSQQMKHVIDCLYDFGQIHIEPGSIPPGPTFDIQQIIWKTPPPIEDYYAKLTKKILDYNKKSIITRETIDGIPALLVRASVYDTAPLLELVEYLIIQATTDKSHAIAKYLITYARTKQ